MIDDLHQCIWFTYRRAIGADASWNAAHAFQAALEVYLRRRPGTDAASACQEAARMIMIRPRGIANRGRIVATATSKTVSTPSSPVVSLAGYTRQRQRRAHSGNQAARA